MANAGFRHSEAFLQWIWENLLFDFTNLSTAAGQQIHIIDAGELNLSDGPDFKQAAIEINGVKWHGDIEIHTKSTHWKAHGHHTDPKYNSVILHVVVDNNARSVSTEIGSSPFTLNLLPYLSKQLNLFLQSFDHSDDLPCTSSLHFISEKAFYQQLEKAHSEYFEKKSNDFLRFYDPEILPSNAWKKALILSIWDGLGIAHNRMAMQQTAQQLLNKWDGTDIDQGLDLALDIAGFRKRTSRIRWNYKSVRPSNQPRNRITEAVKLSHAILQEPFRNLLSKENISEIWNRWIVEASLRNSSRIDILFGTVFLPSIFVLGNLFAYRSLSSSALTIWKNLKTPIPASLLNKFKSFELNDNSYQKKLGSVHQLKSYCNEGKCSECFVLKKAIQS